MFGAEEPDAKAQVGAAIFLADTAENGAGYAVELGRASQFENLLKSTLEDLRNLWDAPEHIERCDTSCPDCLRAYDNSRKHALLDWRLALDMLELCTGTELTVGRSLPQTAKWMETSAQALNGSAVACIEGVPAITRNGKCVLLFHPLWRLEPAYFNDAQAAAFDQAESSFSTVAVEDLRNFRRNPLKIWPQLK
jgi:DEAD/DEAH box helicase domain-containing protein